MFSSSTTEEDENIGKEDQSDIALTLPCAGAEADSSSRTPSPPSQHGNRPAAATTSDDVFSTTSSSHSSDTIEISDPKDDFISNVNDQVNVIKRRSAHLFEDCFVVTNLAVYLLRLCRNPVATFIEAATQGDVKSADKVAATFGLEAKALLELAADIRLKNRDFSSAIALYRLSGCKHLKSVLKFAASGHVSELLWYLTVLNKTPNLDVSLSDKIHLANLTLMAYFQQTLVCKVCKEFPFWRNLQIVDKCPSLSAPAQTDQDSPSTHSDDSQVVASVSHAQNVEELKVKIGSFLDENIWIDESLAIRLAIETRQWSLLRHLCVKRGLLLPMLEAVVNVFAKALESSMAAKRPDYYTKTKSLSDIVAKVVSDMAPSERRGVLECLTCADLLVCSQVKPAIALDYLQILKGILPFLTPSQLEAVSEFCSPWHPGLIPTMRPLYLDKKKQSEQNQFPVKLLEFYFSLQVSLLKQTQQQQPICHYPDLVGWVVNQPKHTNHDTLSSKFRPGLASILACGPSHVMFNKNNLLFSWGFAQLGVLAHHGVSKVSARFSPPRPVEFFRDINSADVEEEEGVEGEMEEADDMASVSSSLNEEQFLGCLRRQKLNVISVACGKSHSMALTDGGLYVWGSSKYGQLGLGRLRLSAKQPELVMALSGRVTISIAAGHYHSVALDSNGHLWTWGWGVHGQLGLGDIEDEHWPQVIRFLN